jgi:hypothetical protein
VPGVGGEAEGGSLGDFRGPPGDRQPLDMYTKPAPQCGLGRRSEWSKTFHLWPEWLPVLSDF